MKRGLGYRFLLWSVLITLVYCHQSHTTQNFLFSEKPSLMIPGIVHVGLIGFSADGGNNYSLDLNEYERYLENMYKFNMPTCSEDDQDNFIKFFVRYRLDKTQETVFQVEAFIIMQLIELINNGMVSDPIASIPVTEQVHLYFDEIYNEAYGIQTGWNSNRYVVLIINPSINRILQHLRHHFKEEHDKLEIVNDIMGYNWSYNGIPTNSFIGIKSFAMIDVTAYSVYIGPSSTPFGVRNPISIPMLSDFVEDSLDRVQNTLFQSSLGNAIHSLVTHVFFSDVGFTPYIDSWDHIFIPVMVFKNHGEHIEVDEETISKEIRKIFHESTQIDIKFGTHSLHDHKHVSIAVSKSLRSHISHELDNSGAVLTKERTYLDSKELTIELRRSADSLGSLLLGSKGTGGRNKKILPVYIFSLYGLDSNLLLDNYERVTAQHDSIIILQTEHQKIPVPLIIDMDNVFTNGTDITRHVIGGVALSQGLALPYKKYSTLHERDEYDYSWTLGDHPFGPFATSERISPLFVSSLRRNAVLSRLHRGMSIIRDTVVKLDNFAEKYLHGVLESVDGISSWIDSVYHGTQPEQSPLLYTNTVDRLHSEIIDLANQMEDINTSLRQFKNDEAFVSSQSFVFKAKNLYEYAEQELELAEVKLQCCKIRYTPPSGILYYAIIALSLSFIAAFAPIFIVLLYWTIRSQGKSTRRKKSSVLPVN